MTVVKLSFLLYYPVSGFVLQTASRCESRAKCRDTSMHWRMIRIDIDFRFKNTDSPHEIVACLQFIHAIDCSFCRPCTKSYYSQKSLSVSTGTVTFIIIIGRGEC